MDLIIDILIQLAPAVSDKGFMLTYGVPIATISIAIATLAVGIFTLCILRNGLKNWRVDKTVELYRTMRKEQDALLAVSDTTQAETEDMATHDYLNELELIVILYNKKHLDAFLYSEILLPFITYYIKNNNIKAMILSKQKEDKAQKLPNSYCNLLELINQQEKIMSTNDNNNGRTFNESLTPTTKTKNLTKDALSPTDKSKKIVPKDKKPPKTTNSKPAPKK